MEPTGFEAATSFILVLCLLPFLVIAVLILHKMLGPVEINHYIWHTDAMPKKKSSETKSWRARQSEIIKDVEAFGESDRPPIDVND